MQVQLPGTMKASTGESGADVNGNGFFADAGHLEDGDSCLKAHLHLSVEAEVFIRRKRGPEQSDQGRGCTDEHSPFRQGR